jgi:translocation and assembly module TamB
VLAKMPLELHRHRRLRRRLIATALAALVLSVGFLAARLWFESSAGARVLEETVRDALATPFEGRIDFESLTVVDGEIVAHDVSLFTPDGERVARVDTLRASLQLNELVKRHVLLTHLNATGVTLELVEGPKGLNLLRALKPRGASSSTSSNWSVTAPEIVVEKASVTFSDGTPRGKVSDLRLEGRLQVPAHDSMVAGKVTARGTLVEPFNRPIAFELTSEPDGGQSRLRGSLEVGQSSAQIFATSAPWTTRLENLVLAPEELRPFLPEWRLETPILVQGTFSETRASLQAVNGNAKVEASSDFSVSPLAVRALDVTLSKVSPSLVGLTSLPMTIDGHVSATLSDVGLTTATGRASADLTWRASETPVERAPHRATLRLTAARGVFDISTLEFEAPGAKLKARGVVHAAQTALVGGLRVEDFTALTAFLASIGGPAVPLRGRGQASVTIAGPLLHPAISATGDVPALSTPWGTLDGLEARVSLGDISRPRAGSLLLTARRLFVGGRALDTFRAEATLRDDRSIDVSSSARGQVPFQLAAGGRLASSWSEVQLERLRLDRGEASTAPPWTLEQPVHLRWAKSALRLEPFLLRSGDERLRAQLRLTDGTLDAAASADGLLVRELPAGILPARWNPGGRLSVSLEARGPAAHPTIDVSASLSDARFEGIDGVSARAQLHLAHEEASRGEVSIDALGGELRGRFSSTPMPRTGATISRPTPSGIAAHAASARTAVENSIAATTPGTATARPLVVQLSGSHLQLAELRRLALRLEGGAVATDVGDAALVGLVSFESTLEGSLAAPRGTLDIHLTDARLPRLGASAAVAHFDAENDGTRARVEVTSRGAKLARLDAFWGLPIEAVVRPAAPRDARARLDLEASLYPVELAHLRAEPAEATSTRGTASATLRLSGALDNPSLDFRGSIQKLTFDGTALGSVRLIASGDAHRQVVSLAMGGLGKNDLKADGTLGLEFARSSLTTPRFWATAPISLEVSSKQLDVAFLSGIDPFIRRVGGTLDVSGRIGGTLGALETTGSLKWRNGALSLLGSGEYRDIDAAVVTRDGFINVQHLTMRSGVGLASLEAVFRKAGPRTFSVEGHAKTEKFPVMTNDQLLATASLEARFNGDASATAVRIRRLEVDRAEVSLPDIRRKDLQDLDRAADIVLVRSERVRRRKTPTSIGVLAPSPFSWSAALVAPRGLWLRSSDLGVELGLSEDFRVDSSNQLNISGEAVMLRGKVSVIGREFVLQRNSSARFLGLPSEPVVDITAFHTNESEKAKITVRLAGRWSDATPIMSSEPAMSESEIYALLATGRRQLLRGSGSSITADQAVSAVGQIAASQIKTVLAKNLPIDVLNFEAADNFQKLKFDVGKYLSDKFYLGVTAQTGAVVERGENPWAARLEYQMTPHWSVEGFAGTAPAAGLDLVWSTSF